MPIEAWVAGNGGIVRTTAAYKAGFSKHDVASAVRSGVLNRVARSWVCASNCVRDAKWAAMLNGHITCVSAAKLLGLWVIDDIRCHIAVQNNSNVKPNRDKVRLHYGSAPVPRPKHEVLDPVVNIIATAAGCQSFESAVALADSAIRAGFVTRSELMRIQTRSPAVARVAEASSELSDSGIETIPRVRLAAIGIPLRQQVKIAGHRVDGLIGERLVLQFDGAEHLTREQKQIDVKHDAELQLLGYTVLRFTYWDVMDMWHHVEATIQRAIAQGLHLDSSVAA